MPRFDNSRTVTFFEVINVRRKVWTVIIFTVRISGEVGVGRKIHGP